MGRWDRSRSPPSWWGGSGSAFLLTDEQVEIVGEGAKRFPVAAAINGHRLRTTVVRMRGEFLLGVSRAAREANSVQTGDTVTFALELDQAPREVEVPAALEAALDADPEARRVFDGLASTHRKEYARWITEGRREETRGAAGRPGRRDDPHGPDAELTAASRELVHLLGFGPDACVRGESCRQLEP